MTILKVYSIFMVLLMLFVTAYSEDADKYEVIISGVMLVPILVYLLYGGN